MTPSDAHEHLTFFEGTWTMAEMAPEANFRETCAWMGNGRRHMLCRSRWQARSGPREGLSIFSFRAADSLYVYQGFRPSGAVQTLFGRVEAGEWDFWGEEGTGADRIRTRVHIAPSDDGTFVFTEQTATGDGDWSEEEVVHYQAAPAESP